MTNFRVRTSYGAPSEWGKVKFLKQRLRLLSSLFWRHCLKSRQDALKLPFSTKRISFKNYSLTLCRIIICQ